MGNDSGRCRQFRREHGLHMCHCSEQAVSVGLKSHTNGSNETRTRKIRITRKCESAVFVCQHSLTVRSASIAGQKMSFFDTRWRWSADTLDLFRHGRSFLTSAGRRNDHHQQRQSRLKKYRVMPPNLHPRPDTVPDSCTHSGHTGHETFASVRYGSLSFVLPS